MWPFKKKKEEEKTDALDDVDDDDEEDQEESDDQGVGAKIEKMEAQFTKINGTLESFKEVRKSTAERFSTLNEQMGEIRGMITDLQRTMGMVEVKATKASDLVDSVQPDKLMIQVQKEDGKIEGLRGMLEAKEEMMKNMMDQIKKIRDQMKLFSGVEQIIKLNEEVKDELMGVKRVVASVERHADRVDNIFIEAQKSFQAFNTFSDRLDDLKTELKELTTKADKLEVVGQTFHKKAEFEQKFEKIEKSDKRTRKLLDEVEAYYKGMDEKFKKMEGGLRGEFEFKIEKAEILSKAFDDLLAENPLFADGLRLQEYLDRHIGGSGDVPAAGAAEAKSEGDDSGDAAEGDKKKEGEAAEGEEKKEGEAAEGEEKKEVEEKKEEEKK